MIATVQGTTMALPLPSFLIFLLSMEQAQARLYSLAAVEVVDPNRTIAKKLGILLFHCSMYATYYTIENQHS
jgi:hypothetical protein